MSPFLAVLAVVGQGSPSEAAPLLRPMVVVTRDPQPDDVALTSGEPSVVPDPKSLGKWIQLDRVQTRAKILAERGYVVRDAGPFLLAASPDLLGVPQARRETALLREVARCAQAGTSVLAVKDLPAAEGATLRRLVSGFQTPELVRVANAPYLRFGIATRGTLDVQSGRLRKPLELLPGTGLGQSERKAMEAAVMRPDAEDAANGVSPPDPKRPVAIEKSVALAPRGRLTFLVPPRLPGDQGLEWMGVAQGTLLKEAREARADWTQARDALMAALQKVADAPFVHPPASGVAPRFADLTPEAQNKAAQFFGSVYRNELGGQRAEDWLLGTQTLGYRAEPVLTVAVADGGPGWCLDTIPFQCPVGP